MKEEKGAFPLTPVILGYDCTDPLIGMILHFSADTSRSFVSQENQKAPLVLLQLNEQSCD